MRLSFLLWSSSSTWQERFSALPVFGLQRIGWKIGTRKHMNFEGNASLLFSPHFSVIHLGSAKPLVIYVKDSNSYLEQFLPIRLARYSSKLLSALHLDYAISGITVAFFTPLATHLAFQCKGKFCEQRGWSGWGFLLIVIFWILV